MEPNKPEQPNTPLRWSAESNRGVARALEQQGLSVSAGAIPSLLKQANLVRHPFLSLPPDQRISEQFEFVALAVEVISRFSIVLRVDVHEVPPPSDTVVPAAYFPVDSRADAVGRILGTLFSWGETESNWIDRSQAALVVMEAGGLVGINDEELDDELQRTADTAKRIIVLCFLPPGFSRWNWPVYRWDDQRFAGGLTVTLDEIRAPQGRGRLAGDTVRVKEVVSRIDNAPNSLRRWNRIYVPKNADDLFLLRFHKERNHGCNGEPPPTKPISRQMRRFARLDRFAASAQK